MGAELLEKVQLPTVSVPLLSMPPPSPAVFPWAIVIELRLSVAPEFTDNTSKELAPSTVMLCPVPSIVRLPGELFAIAGSVPCASVIVPQTLKRIVSLPVPAAQSPPDVSDLALALLIASRKVQNPLPEVLAGSVLLLTVITFGVGVAVGVAVAVEVAVGVADPVAVEVTV